MSNSSVLSAPKRLTLTEEEAFALLDMCTLTLASERPSHLRVLAQLGGLCREWLAKPSAGHQEEPQSHFASNPLRTRSLAAKQH